MRADIMMAKSMNALFTGRIQKRKTQSPPSLTSGLQHTAGQGRGSYMSASAPIATVNYQKVIGR